LKKGDLKHLGKRGKAAFPLRAQAAVFLFLFAFTLIYPKSDASYRFLLTCNAILRLI
jgi:hypothetical protein